MRTLVLLITSFFLIMMSGETAVVWAQDSVAAANSGMYAAMRQIHFAADLTPGVGPIDSSQPLMTINVRNDSDHQLIIESFSVTFRVSGTITAWPSFDGSCSTDGSSEPMYRMLFRIPRGQGTTMMFPSPGFCAIEPHSSARIDLFAEIPDAPRVNIASATTFTQFNFILGPWRSILIPDIHGRNWRVP